MQMTTSTPSAHGETHDPAAAKSFLPPGAKLPFALVTALFFLWGMSNNLTDILVQQFRKGFTLSQLEAQLVQTSVFLGYFFMALPAAGFMRRKGYKAGILLGLSLFATGTLLFWPAAVVGRYALFLVALFFVGCGSATLETASNPLVAEFGSAATSERRLNFAQSFNPVGSITGILIGTYCIFSGVELSPAKVQVLTRAHLYHAYVHGEIMRVVPTYIGLACAVLLAALLIARTRFPAFATARQPEGTHSTLRDLLPHRILWLSVLAQFFYVGAQVSTWSAFIPYLRQYTTLSERTGGWMLAGSLLSLAVGRMSSTLLMRRFRPLQMILVYALINIALLAAGVLHPGIVGACTILATSLFMSIIFPTIFAIGIKGLGRHTKLGGSFIVMSVIGGAVLPPMLGLVAHVTGSLALGYLIPMASYAVIVLYAMAAHRIRPALPIVPSIP